MDTATMRVSLAIALASLALGWLLARWVARARMRARFARARRGEQTARHVLRAHGYDVLDEQAPGAVTLDVDGRASTFALRADYLVRKAGRRYVAEVKTGDRATSLAHGPTRRQLLEYGVAFAVDGVLLVDPEAGTVRTIRFDRGHRSARSFVLGLAAGVMVSAAAAATLFVLTSP